VTKQILRLPEVQARTGLSRSTIYQLVARGLFPKPVHLSERRTGFVADEIEQWILSRVRDSRAEPSNRPGGKQP
jgi:prophage regulatory protein